MIIFIALWLNVIRVRKHSLACKMINEHSVIAGSRNSPEIRLQPHVFGPCEEREQKRIREERHDDENAMKS